jgi:hypothetical protein
MLKHLMPQDRILRRAIQGIFFFIILSIIGGGLGAWDAYRRGWLDRDHEDISQIVWQFGIGSPEAASEIKYIGESQNPKELVALLDPVTGIAVTTWPAKYAGKAPEEMILVSGLKLPSLKMLPGRMHFTLRHQGSDSGSLLSDYRNRVIVRVEPLLPGGEKWQRYEKHQGVTLLPPTQTATPDTVSVRPANREHGDRNHRQENEDDSRMLPMTPPLGYLLVVSTPQTYSILGITASFIGAAGALGFLLYWLSIAWWVFIDARQRGGRAFAWGILTLLTNIVGVATYLVARREWRFCPTCEERVEKSFRHCPHCGHALQAICKKCGNTLNRDWAFCVNCAESVSKT